MASQNAGPSEPRHSRRTSSINDDESLAFTGGATTRQLDALTRKVTATASHLMSPLGDGAVTQHYQNALGDMHRQLRRPMLQRSVYSIVNMKSSLVSGSEIQQRALAYLPDELLQHVPESTASFSLFDGFQASLPEDEEKHKRHRRHHRARNSRGQKMVGDAEGGPEGGSAPPDLNSLKQERQYLDRRLDSMAVRKSMCSSEIREIDVKLANLATMRKTVLERLAALESEESELEHELLDLDNNIDELAEKLQASAAASQHSPTTVNSGDDKAGITTPPSEFMSESIYASPATPPRRGRRMSRKAMPILHEHMEPGSLIREFPAHTDTITALGFDAPFGTLVTASMDDTLRVWDMNAGRCLGMLEGHLTPARVVQVEDNLVATGAIDATVRLWDLSRAEYTSQPSQNIGSEEPTSEDEDEDSLSQPSVSLQNCALYTLNGHVDQVTALSFHGDTLVSGGADRTLRQWDLETGRCVQTLDVLWAAAQSTSTIGGSDSSWRQAGRSADSSADFVGALQVYGAALAVGFSDSMIRLFDLRSGKVHRSLVGHTDAVTALQFDDLHLVTASQDRSVRIWDLRTGTIFDAYAYDAPITSMNLDDRRIVSAAGEDVVKVFDKPESRQWDCGPGILAAKDPSYGTPSTVERVRIRDGFTVEGRRDGMVGIWSC